MHLIVTIIDILTDALVICGVVMAVGLIGLWIRQVATARPPEE